MPSGTNIKYLRPAHNVCFINSNVVPVCKSKFVCTIGPATETLDQLRELILNGMNTARLNFSHCSHDVNTSKTYRLLLLVHPFFSILVCQKRHRQSTAVIDGAIKARGDSV